MGSSPRVQRKHQDALGLHRAPRLIPARAGKTCSALRAPTNPGAHPRACGENRGPAHLHVRPGGSSPRVRGKHVAPLVSVAVFGLIPARAGKTRHRQVRRASTTAHPRACGENETDAGIEIAARGSSPRVRGKLRVVNRARAGVGLIPARAGKTLNSARYPCGPWAHPRACGENARLTLWPPARRGSSPRVRGKLSEYKNTIDAQGLIPARAGKTVCVCCCLGVMGAHPRACGENARRRGGAVPDRGSSPRVRGKPSPVGSSPSASRLIPARAGKTRRRSTRSAAPSAHPRACGENPCQQPSVFPRRGSSPRVRGKHYGSQSAAPPDWLIPARAGKTIGRGRWRRRRGAHPRACGENSLLSDPQAILGGSSPRVRGKQPPLDVREPAGGGSSPRVRGKRCLRSHGHRPGGLIPARAGKTGPTPSASSTKPAHPRACGENDYLVPDRQRDPGSSPRVRGKQSRGAPCETATGLIPARAGKTGATCTAPSSGRAHPRACGENLMSDCSDSVYDGSSPRVRGKRGGDGEDAGLGGLIPARAGKTP